LKKSSGIILKNLSFMASSTALMQITTFSLTLIVANVFGPSGLAKFNITQTTINTFASLSQFGFGYTAINYISKSNDDDFLQKIIDICLKIPIYISLFICVVMVFYSRSISNTFFSNEELSIYIIYAALGLPFASVALVQMSALNGFEGYRSMAAISIATTFLTLALVVAGAWSYGLAGATVGFVLSIILRGLMLQRELGKFVAIRLSLPSLEAWQSIKHFAIPAGLAGLSLTPSIWFANSLVIKHVGLEGQGIVIAALTIRMAISFVPQQLSAVLLPQYLRSIGEPRSRHMLRMATYMTVLVGVSSVLCLFAFLLRGPLISVFGPSFHADPLLFGLLLGTTVIEAIGLPFSFLYARREQMWRYLFIFTYPKDLALVVAALFLIPQNGALGLAQAYMISAGLGLSMLFAANAKTLFFRNA
jgi:O-antigen/teichoic acid export membrane protein